MKQENASRSVRTDTLHVVEPRAAGLDVHKLQVTASTRLCERPARQRAPGTRRPVVVQHPRIRRILECSSFRA